MPLSLNEMSLVFGEGWAVVSQLGHVFGGTQKDVGCTALGVRREVKAGKVDPGVVCRGVGQNYRRGCHPGTVRENQ